MTDSKEAQIGLPWAQVSPRWGHPWHSMCSYLGTFPPVMAHALIGVFSEPGSSVFDPFCGRGTTALEARLLGRHSFASDLNPLAVSITAAKSVSIIKSEAVLRLEELKAGYDALMYHGEAQAQPDEIQLIFNLDTLAQLCYLRRRLSSRVNDIDTFLVGVVLGVMHGGERLNGESAYASISMPNTFSMSPEYVRRFVQEKQLRRVARDVFQLMRQKVDRLFEQAPPTGRRGETWCADAKVLLEHERVRQLRRTVDLILTSPPYLNVVNYALQNWIRLWFLDELPCAVDVLLDDHLTLGPWLDFMENFLEQAEELLSDHGCMILVIGDVAKSANNIVSPARELIRRIYHKDSFGYVGCAVDRLNTDEKVSRIWKATKGRATAIDRVVILANAEPRIRSFNSAALGIDESGTLDARLLSRYARRFAGL